jgi:nitrile hydratase accessory protein
MSTAGPRPAVDLETTGPAAPPRSNGELVFAEPWESRIFGVTMALQQADVISPEEFRSELIASIARWEAEHPSGEEYRYYRCWFDAVQRVLHNRSIVSHAAVDERLDELCSRPAGHDHDHHHGHDPDEPHGSPVG